MIKPLVISLSLYSIIISSWNFKLFLKQGSYLTYWRSYKNIFSFEKLMAIHILEDPPTAWSGSGAKRDLQQVGNFSCKFLII